MRSTISGQKCAGRRVRRLGKACVVEVAEGEGCGGGARVIERVQVGRGRGAPVEECGDAHSTAYNSRAAQRLMAAQRVIVVKTIGEP